MNKRKSLLFILMLTIFSTNIVKAECTTEEENNIRKEIDKIKPETDNKKKDKMDTNK